MKLLPTADEFQEHRWFDISRRLQDRRILARYSEAVRPSCLHVLAEITAVLPVPDAIFKIAAEPQSVRDLYALLIWLATAANPGSVDS
jgi:hypothetical protein